MARDKLTEYSATASENTVCGDVNIAENSALPSDLNNFAREVMSHLKAFSDGTDAIDALNLGTTTDAATVSNTASDYQLQLGAAQSTTGDIGRNISFALSGTTTAAINTVDAGTGNAQSLAFFTGNGTSIAERLRILSGGGLTFNGDTAAANALSDYEQGSWNPTAATNSGNAASFDGSVMGRYVKIGNLVTINGFVKDVNTTGTTGSSQFKISGLPYSPTSENWTGVASTNNVTFQSSRTMLTCEVKAATNDIGFSVTADNQSRAGVDHSHINSGTSDFFFSVQYQTF